jgi:hypothetical protein
MNMKQFLNEVASGGKGLRPRSDSVDDLAAFQPIVETALEAESLGYVEKVNAHRESHTGHRFYSALIVIGLTEAGRAIISGP